MLISKEVLVKWSPSNKKHFESKGYIFTNWNDEFLIKVEDLSKGSQRIVDVQCDECKKIMKQEWRTYNRYLKSDNTNYCINCNTGTRVQSVIKTRLHNGKSFENWCVNNGKKDILDLWDYELNELLPSQITYGTLQKYYFKCGVDGFESELQCIHTITNKRRISNNIKHSKLDSFAQYGIDNICEDFLEKYWDYDKNTINPWDV